MQNVEPSNSSTKVDGVADDDDDSYTMGDLYRDIRVEKQRRKHQKLMSFNESPLKGMLHEHTEYHYSIVLLGDRLDYWPSGSRWRWRNKTSFGDWLSCYNFIRKRLNQAMENAGRKPNPGRPNELGTPLQRISHDPKADK